MTAASRILCQVFEAYGGVTQLCQEVGQLRLDVGAAGEVEVVTTDRANLLVLPDVAEAVRYSHHGLQGDLPLVGVPIVRPQILRDRARRHRYSFAGRGDLSVDPLAFCFSIMHTSSTSYKEFF